MMGDEMENRGVVELRNRAPKDYQAALLVVVFIIGLFVGIVVGLTMQPEEKTAVLPAPTE